jgi:opacity protein-like surface antigen
MHRLARFAAVVTLLALAPAALHAQGLADYDYENLSLRGVGVDFGRIWPNKVDATTTYALRFDLGFLGPAVRIVPSVSYWNSTLKRSELERLAIQLEEIPILRDQGVTIGAEDLGRIEWSDVGLNLDAQAVWTAPGNVFTYIGAGVGLHVMNGRGGAIDGTFIEDLLDSTPAGLAVMAGLEYEFARRLRVFGEGRYTLQSDVRYPGMKIGAAVMFPPPANALGRVP